MNIQIMNGRVIDPLNQRDQRTDLYISQGKVVALAQPPKGFVAEQTIDAAGCIVMPGLVDLAARLREPGYEYLATLESEMRAATAGGVTSLACPPDTDPPLDEPGLLEMLKHRARSLHQARVYPVAALTVGLKGKALTEMAELRDAGCVAFSQANEPLMDTKVLMNAMRYAATFGFSVWLNPLDNYLSKGGVAHDGEVAARCGLSAIPVCAETIALSKMLLLARETGVRLHICRISSAEGVEMVRQAKQEGLTVSCDVSMNHVHLSEMDIGYFDPNCHLIPPLRSQRDQQALRAGLMDGTIDAICSNHSPVDDDAKQLPFAEAEPGATGLELLLPLTLKWAEQSGLPLAEALARITSRPAEMLGVDAGHLSPGASADICIVDPEQYWLVDARSLRSQGKNTPFFGMELKGQVKRTLVGGNTVFSVD